MFIDAQEHGQKKREISLGSDLVQQTWSLNPIFLDSVYLMIISAISRDAHNTAFRVYLKYTSILGSLSESIYIREEEGNLLPD